LGYFCGTLAVPTPWYSRIPRLPDMSFSFVNASFIDELGSLTGQVARSAFRLRAPKALYHYKSPELVQKIIESKNMWATCVIDQEDLTELTHGIAVVERLAIALIDRESNLFVRRVLAALPQFMRSRREMIFITCFCGVKKSDYHLAKYGTVCFKFDIPENWIPTLECQSNDAEIWYSPVIYGERDQGRAVSQFLNGITRLLKRYANGQPEHDRGGQIGFTVIRDIGLCLLTLISCFKREMYKPDEEWRLVVMPKLALSYTAPQMIDDAFATLVIKEPKRHICLRRKIPLNFTSNVLWPPPESARGVPFDQII
jgi:hypothetical protein